MTQYGSWVLGNILHRIYLTEQIEPIDYDLRNRLVVKAVYNALLEGVAAGFRVDPNEPEWPVAYIELPTGQVSWHLPQHATAWDGHSTEEKHRRVQAFVQATRYHPE